MDPQPPSFAHSSSTAISIGYFRVSKSFTFKTRLRDSPEISRGGGGVETEGGSHFFETAEKGGVMKNGPLKGGGSCKCVSVIM